MIKRRYFYDLTVWWRSSCRYVLIGCWLLGMLFGLYAAFSASDFLVPMMRGVVAHPVSFVGLLSATLLPLLFSAFAVSLSEPWLLLLISTVKAFSFSFCACGICLAFGQSSWLVRFLFLFSDHCTLPVLMFYWLRHIDGAKNQSIRESCVFLCIVILIGCIDYWLIAPFLVSLI